MCEVTEAGPSCWDLHTHKNSYRRTYLGHIVMQQPSSQEGTLGDQTCPHLGCGLQPPRWEETSFWHVFLSCVLSRLLKTTYTTLQLSEAWEPCYWASFSLFLLLFVFPCELSPVTPVPDSELISFQLQCMEIFFIFSSFFFLSKNAANNIFLVIFCSAVLWFQGSIPCMNWNPGLALSVVISNSWSSSRIHRADNVIKQAEAQPLEKCQPRFGVGYVAAFVLLRICTAVQRCHDHDNS